MKENIAKYMLSSHVLSITQGALVVKLAETSLRGPWNTEKLSQDRAGETGQPPGFTS